MKNILVIGATGHQGTPVAEQLIAAGFKVRALVRDRSKADALVELGVEVLTGDLEDAASIDAAVAGQDGVFMLLSFFFGTAKQAETLITSAKRAGVRQIVWNVTGPILPFDTGNPSIDFRRPVLAALEASGIPFVALQPTVYMENFLIPAIAREIAEKDTLAYPMPETVNCQWISHQDAAAYVVAAFLRGPVDTQLTAIAGPERLTGPQIAEHLGRGLGRTIRFRPMPPAEFAKAVAFGGAEEAIVRYYSSVFDNPDVMSTDVDHAAALSLFPITPLSMENWARRYSVAFERA